MTQPSAIVSDILTRADELMASHPDLSEAKLGKLLFGKGNALDEIRAGRRDPHTQTAEAALRKLKALKRSRAPRRQRRVT